MERFIVVGALIFAGLVALSPVLDGGEGLHFDISDDDKGEQTQTQSSGAALPEQVFTADSLRLRGLAATVKVIPEDRKDVAVSVTGGAGLNQLRINDEGGEVVIDGGYRRTNSCQSSDGAFSASVGGREVSAAQMPVITVRAPKTLELSISGAVQTEIGALDQLTLELATCGDTKVAAVAKNLEVSLSGSGSVIAGDVAGAANLSIAGSGGVSFSSVGDLDTDVAGSGATRVEKINGDLNASIAGSGDLRIEDGRIGVADISIVGSGETKIDAVIDTLDLNIIGSGRVTASKVKSVREQSVMGSGEVRIDRVGDAPAAAPAPPTKTPTPPTPPTAPKPL